MCEMELTNKHTNNAIAVKNKDQKVIGHLPEALESKFLSYSLQFKSRKLKESILSYRMRNVKYQKEYEYLKEEVLKYLANLSFMDDVYKTFVNVYKDKD